MRRVQRTKAIRRIERCPIPHIANAWVAERKRLRHAQNNRRTGLQRTCIGLVARAVLEEDAVAPANRGLAVTNRIPGKANSRCRIKQMPFHTTRRVAVDAALNQTQVAHNSGIQLESDGIERY